MVLQQDKLVFRRRFRGLAVATVVATYGDMIESRVDRHHPMPGAASVLWLLH